VPFEKTNKFIIIHTRGERKIRQKVTHEFSFILKIGDYLVYCTQNDIHTSKTGHLSFSLLQDVLSIS